MKFFGLILVFLSATFLGLLFANKYISCLKDMKRVEFLLKNIILCLNKENTAVVEILKNCAKISDKETEKFLSSVSPEEFDMIAKVSDSNGFCSDKITNMILQEAFSVLGKYDASEQIKELEFCRKKVSELYEKNENALISKAKLSRCFGILLGAFLVIVMI